MDVATGDPSPDSLQSVVNNSNGFPADEGVQLNGYDGIVEVVVGNQYVPPGISAWELAPVRMLRVRQTTIMRSELFTPGPLIQTTQVLYS